MSAAALKPGIYDIPEAEYRDDCADVPSLSSSIAKILIADTPLHAWAAHPRLNPNFVREEKEIFDRGTIAHALLLQGVEAGAIVEADDWRKKEAKEQRDLLRSRGQIPILRKHWDGCVAMVQRAKEQLAHHSVKDAFTAGRPEPVIIWEDHASDGTTVMCRGRLDWLDDDFSRIFDYKSTGRDVNPETIAAKMLGDGWDVQAEFYCRGIEKLTSKRPELFYVAQENSEPYALSVIGVGPDFQWLGAKKVQLAIDIWAQCTKTGNWPGYPMKTCFPILPKWAEEQWIRREEQEA